MQPCSFRVASAIASAARIASWRRSGRTSTFPVTTVICHLLPSLVMIGVNSGRVPLRGQGREPKVKPDFWLRRLPRGRPGARRPRESRGGEAPSMSFPKRRQPAASPRSCGSSSPRAPELGEPRAEGDHRPYTSEGSDGVAYDRARLVEIFLEKVVEEIGAPRSAHPPTARSSRFRSRDGLHQNSERCGERAYKVGQLGLQLFRMSKFMYP